MSQLALRLIEKEKEAKTGYLDLGRCGLNYQKPISRYGFFRKLSLEEVWEALSELTHIKTLILSNQWQENDKLIQSQNKGKRNLMNIIPTQIAKLVNLKKLIIAGDNDYEYKWKIKRIENLPKKLISLDISNNKISDISPLIPLLKKGFEFNYDGNLITKTNPKYIIAKEKVEKTGYLELGCCGLTHESPHLQEVWSTLSELTHLETLILSNKWYDKKSDKWSFSKNNNQRNLLRELPKAILSLVNLKVLIIESQEIQKLQNLDTLTSLEYLTFFSNQIKKIEGLESLTNLRYFDISYNQLEKLEGLDTLTNLEYFDIFNNKIRRLEGLSNLINLEHLNIRVNRIDKIEGLEKLINLKNFNISNVNIAHFNSISKIENLPTNIETLNISNNKITKIENLPQRLVKLDISGNQISKIENLPQHISTLEIYSNQISKIENLPESISTLNIQNNQLIELGSLPKSMKNINITYNKIKNLKPLHQFIKRGIDYRIGNNPIEKPPIQIVEAGSEAIIRYFDELKKTGETQVKEAKLILTGSGEVGKTSLRYRLIDRTKELPKEEERTKQVDVDKYWLYTRSKGDFVAHIWDFGGQQIIHHFHRFFMNDSSLYILLTETSRENDDFDYWLQTIQLYGKDSPILFVQNKRNGMPRSLDISHYKNNFNIKEGLFNVNLLNNEGLDELENAIKYQIQKLPHMQRTIPRSWLGIREALDKLKGDSGGYITFEKFREICGEQDITDRAKIEDVGQFLHRLGVVLWYKDNPVLRQKIILERHWATEGIFKLVFDEEIQKTGHFSFTQAQALWDPDEAYCHHTNDLIALMREFKICFPRKSQSDHYIIPALLTATAPHVEWKADNRMTVEYYYPTILPRGLINYLTAEMYDDILDDAHAWSAGVWLHTGDTQAKIEENRFHRKIRITLSGAQHRELFGGIKKVVDNIHKDYPGMEPELRIPCICPTCTAALQTDKEYYEYSDIIRRLERHKRTVECRKSYDDVSVKRLLNHILRREDYDETYRGEAKRIFVSYSHKDIAYKERLETAFAVQARNGKVEIWNDQEILGGEDWNEEIFEHLESADIIVLLFSPDFFASNFIWEKELPVVMRRYGNKSVKVFPVLLRPCDWIDTEYRKIQAVPSEDGKLKAISQWDNEDEAWQTVVHGIKKAIK